MLQKIGVLYNQRIIYYYSKVSYITKQNYTYIYFKAIIYNQTSYRFKGSSICLYKIIFIDVSKISYAIE